MLHVNSLKGKVNVKAIDDALAEVMSGGSSLIAAYDKTMKMIQSQGDEYGKLAKHALSWVAFSDEPLTTSQLQHALAIEPGTTDLVFNNVTKLEIIMSSCAGLVTIQENLRGCSTVHLVHETTQEYLLDTWEKWFGDVRARLARLSLTYLTFQAFETGPCELEAYRISRKEKYPLWNYLGRYFARYIEGKSDSEDARVRSMLEKFFLGDAYVVAHVSARVDFFERAHDIPPTSFNLVRFSPHEHAQIGFSEGSTALHLAIFYRFGSLIPLLLQKNARANETNYHGLTALHLAVVSKYYDGIEYLLSAPEVDVNAAVSKDDWTALSHACKAGDEKAVRLLLACHKIDCNLADKSTITPLMWALHRRQLAVVQLLLERKDIDCNGPDKDGLVPLHYAALGNCRECIKELVDRPDLKVNMRDCKGRKPLIWCIEYRFLQPALQLLSRDDVDFTLPNKTERSPLVHAAQWGQPALMEALLDKLGSRIPATDSNGRTILDHAAKWETWQLLQRLLVRCKTRIRIERPFTGTAIFFTIKKGHREVLELLISQMELNDDWWFIHALALSMENNTLECFEVLEKKLRGWMQYYPEWISACLTRVVWKGCDHILASTLRYARHYAAGIDVEEVHFLHGGIGWKDISILEIVFDVPCAQLDVRDRLGQTALHAMARRQDVVATQMLLFLGADSSLRDSEGLTAFECASHWPGYLFEWRERLNPDSGWAPP
jgi:ankyrin repeat protein